MSQLSVLPLPQDGTSLEMEYALSAADGSLVGHGSAAPALLPEADQVALVLPASAVSWHAVQLPKLPRSASAQKWHAALSGVLEERLLDDPSELHLVAFPSLRLGDLVWVAACRKSDLSRWLQILQDAGRAVTEIWPQLIPGEEPLLHVAGSPQEPIALCSDANGTLMLPLQAMLNHLGDAQVIPASAEPAVASVAERLGMKVSILQPAQWLAQCTQRARMQSVSLAQGEFERSGGHRLTHAASEALRHLAFLPRWRPFRWGLASLLCVQLIGLNAWAWKESAKLESQRSQIKQILVTTFPSVKVVVDAPIQMQREMALLRQTQGQLSGRDFESMYSRFLSASGLRTAPAAIDYVAGELQLRGLDLSSAQTDALLPRLQFSGLAARTEGSALILTHREMTSAGPTTGGKP